MCAVPRQKSKSETPERPEAACFFQVLSVYTRNVGQLTGKEEKIFSDGSAGERTGFIERASFEAGDKFK